MSANERLAVFPSRANQVLIRQRILGANRGLSLLKRKRDAIELKLRELRAELRTYNDQLEELMQEAMLSISRGNFLGTDFKTAPVQCADRADVYIRIQPLRVVGVLLPRFDLVLRPPTSCPLLGLSRGGKQVEIIRKRFQDALNTLVMRASLEYSMRMLTAALRQSNMRLNGLECVVIPRLANTLTYIRDELDEMEREEFYRLKRSQAKQRCNKEAFARMIAAKNMTPEQLEQLEEVKSSTHKLDDTMRKIARSVVSTQTSFASSLDSGELF